MNQPPGPYLDLKQTQQQQLVMTPQLQQAIKLLQLNNLELAEFVEEELEKNPLLEKAENAPEDNAQEDAPQNEATDNIQDEFDEGWKESETPQPQEQDHATNASALGSGGDVKFAAGDDGFENRIKDEKSLREHLSEQLTIACDDNKDRMVGGLLIDQLDESGYLRTDIPALAQQLGCSEERIEKLLRIKASTPPAFSRTTLKNASLCN